MSVQYVPHYVLRVVCSDIIFVKQSNLEEIINVEL